jgi:hypothetical protein
MRPGKVAQARVISVKTFASLESRLGLRRAVRSKRWLKAVLLRLLLLLAVVMDVPLVAKRKVEWYEKEIRRWWSHSFCPKL